jgi:hypothetical protein
LQKNSRGREQGDPGKIRGITGQPAEIRRKLAAILIRKICMACFDHMTVMSLRLIAHCTCDCAKQKTRRGVPAGDANAIIQDTLLY